MSSDAAKLRAAGGPEPFLQLIHAVEVNDVEKVKQLLELHLRLEMGLNNCAWHNDGGHIRCISALSKACRHGHDVSDTLSSTRDGEGPGNGREGREA